MQDSRFFIDAIFGICQRTDSFENLDAFTGDVIDAFKIVRKTLPWLNAPPNGDNTAAQRNTAVQRNTAYQLIHDNGLDQICMAFMVNFVPPELQNKVMEETNDVGGKCRMCRTQISYGRFSRTWHFS